MMGMGMGMVLSFLVKAIASSAACGYTTHRLLAPLNETASISLTILASLLGLTYYLRVWIQGYCFDQSYKEKSPRDLTGYTAIITGGTVNGLGYAAAELLYQRGSNVIITTRSVEKGEAAIKSLKQTSSLSSSSSLLFSRHDDNDNADDHCRRISFVICDFLSESSIRKCAAEIIKTTDGRIDFLVLNAGIASGTTAANMWMTNHLGPWIFGQQLMPSLIQTAKNNPSQHPRVVWVSSGAHKGADIDWGNPFQPGAGDSSSSSSSSSRSCNNNKSVESKSSSISSYGQSKLANIMHMREYQKRIRQEIKTGENFNVADEAGADVKCFAVTPGAVWTNAVPSLPLLYPLFWLVMRPPIIGAQVIKMACLDNDILHGGEYLSNCYVKATEGKNGCSNDENQWKKLWELSSKQIEQKEHEKFITCTADNNVSGTDASTTKKMD